MVRKKTDKATQQWGRLFWLGACFIFSAFFLQALANAPRDKRAAFFELLIALWVIQGPFHQTKAFKVL